MTTAQTGTIISGRYRLEDLLGVGGMGEVYRATDLTMHRVVALKLMRRAAMDEKHVRRMQNEAKVLAALAHPNIVKVQAFDIEDNVAYIAMELVSGESLQAKVEREGPLEPEQCAKLASMIAEGLAHAHQHNVVHRDLKPQNILVTTTGGIKIMDFGIAKLLGVQDQRLTQTGEVVGTPHYIAPEQCTQGGVDTRTDIYSLGGTMYYMLTAKPPFDGETAVEVLMKHNAEAVSLEGIRDANMAAIVGKCLEKEPADRFQSAQELIDAISGKSSAPLSIPKGTTPSRSRTRLPLPILAAIGVCLVAGIMFMSIRKPNHEHVVTEFNLRRAKDIMDVIAKRNATPELVKELESCERIFRASETRKPLGSMKARCFTAISSWHRQW